MHVARFVRRAVVGLTSFTTFCFAVQAKSQAWQPFSKPSANRQPAASAPGANNAAPTDASGKPGPKFQGQELKWPSLPFARQKPANSAQGQSRIASGHNAQAPGQTATRFGAMPGVTTVHTGQPQPQPSLNAHGMPGSNGHHAYAVPESNHPAQLHSAASPQRQPSRTSYRDMTQLAPPPRTTAINHEPLAENRPAQGSIPQESLAEPSIAAQTPPATAASAPITPADRLVTQAHSWTTSAQGDTDYTRIIEACRQARSMQPSEVTARYANELASWAFNRRGQLRAEAGSHQDAMRDFDDSIRADPHRWRALHNRAVLLAQAGEFERAFDDFSRTIELNPKFAKAYSNRGALLMVAGDLAAAHKDYRQAIDLDANLAVAHRGCGRACHLLGMLEDARKHFDDAVRLAPEDSYAAACRADVLTDLGFYGEALAEYERTIAMDPKSSQAIGSSAWLLATCPDASIRNPQLALERAKMAIELTSQKDAGSYDTLAAAQANAGDFATAMETARQAVKLASAKERRVYEERLLLYQHAKPYRIAPVSEVRQASFDASGEQGLGNF